MAIDILTRRTRFAFLNARAALRAPSRVVEIMSDELGWSRFERRMQVNTVGYFENDGLVLGDIVTGRRGRKRRGKRLVVF
ncbi:hypothetical protein F5887DRAFT_956571 [Amanita rubescens]|nr:hypothetical protein F5887DRAFT_956571 [Amanita rubescens]